MINKTILFFPLNSPGHINSSLGIADVMKREFNCRTVFLILGKMMGTSVADRGHELIMLSEANPLQDYAIEEHEDPGEPIDVEAKIRAGKEKQTFEGTFKWPQLVRRAARWLQLPPVEAFLASAHIFEQQMIGELIENHQNYARAIESIGPDLLIIDAYYVPPCVLKLQVPWVRLYSANPLMLVESKLANKAKPAPMIGFQLFDKQKRELMRQSEPDRWQRMVGEWSETCGKIAAAIGQAGQRLNEFLLEQQCSPLEPGKQAHDSPHLNVYMFPEALDYAQDDDLFEYPPLWLRCDSMLRAQPQVASREAIELQFWEEKLQRARQNKEAVVFFSLGSLASGQVNLMKRFVDLLRNDTKRLYVFSKGANGNQYQLDEANMIGDNYIPQTFFLERANLAIIHGGNNSITECAFYGLPMIVLPVFGDQLDNGQRVEDLKLGRRLDVHTCTGAQLLGAIGDILSDQPMRDRLKLIGQKMRSRDDRRRVSSLLAKLANEGALDRADIETYRKESS